MRGAPASRTLAEAAPEAGQVEWDGRDERGRLVPDGDYALLLQGEGGRTLGRVIARVDTNRSTLHDAAGTGLLAVRNLTCSLPQEPFNFQLGVPVWLPSEDEALFLIVRSFVPDFPVGLIRVSLDGDVEYVAQDDWYSAARFLADFGPDRRVESPVSPDGLAVVVERFGQTYVVDLASGARRALAGFVSPRWSPDGLSIVAGDQVLDRSGAVLASLPFGEWRWLPDGARLVNPFSSEEGGDRRAVDVVTRDGTGFSQIVLDSEASFVCDAGVRSDGSVFVNAGEQSDIGGEEGGEEVCVVAESFLVDTVTGEVTRLDWLPPALGEDPRVSWSPALDRLLYPAPNGSTIVASPDGSGALPLAGDRVTTSARGGVAHFLDAACAGKSGSDHFALQSLLNLAATFEALRLPANAGIELRGSVADRHLRSVQLEYAPAAEPNVFRPIGAASEQPVIDDRLALFLPPLPGEYRIRLTARDLAGNERSQIRVVSWELRSPIANLNQSEALISPNGDGVKEAVRFDYLVQEPTLVELQIADEAGTIVRRAGIDHPATGPAFFEWDGRDEGGGGVPDGSYTISLNELPFPVEVDTTPPDIAWSYGEPRAALVPINDEGDESPAFTADRSWHVFDLHLESWTGPGGLSGTEPVFEPELDEDGLIRVDDDGRPIPRRSEGRVADATEDEEAFRLFEAVDGSGLFVAEDLAGNRSTVPVPPPSERLLLVTASVPSRERQRQLVIQPPLDPEQVYRLGPLTNFSLGETLRSPETSEVSFEYRQQTGDWISAGVVGEGSDVIGASIEFPVLGLPLDDPLTGRFSTEGGVTARISEEFRFRGCESFFELAPIGGEEIPGLGLTRWRLRVRGEGEQVVASASVLVSSSTFSRVQPLTTIVPGPGAAIIEGSFMTPTPSCGSSRLTFSVSVTTTTGDVFFHDGACSQLRAVVPDCPLGLTLRREPVACEAASPDRIPVAASVDNPLDVDAFVSLEAGAARLTLAEFVAPPGSSTTSKLVDVSAFPEGVLDVLGRLVAPGVLSTENDARFVVDRTPPTASISAPSEGDVVCVGEDERVLLTIDLLDRPELPEELEPVQLHLRSFAITDPSGAVSELSSSEYRCEGGGCLDAFGSSQLPFADTGLSMLSWDVGSRADGEYTLRLTFCDRSGLETVVERRIVLRRDPPSLTLESDPQIVFSPNGDGASDTATLSVRLDRPADVVVEVRWGASSLRQLASATLPAGLHEFVWDGRDAGGVTAPEGGYSVVVAASDDCGSPTELTVPVEVDLTAPTASLARPVDSEAAGAAVPVRGVATDTNFNSYEIQFGAGSAPTDWTSVLTRTSEAETAAPLGGWGTPAAPGIYTLRLLVTDEADNVGEARVTVDVQPRTFIDRFAVTPDVFSPDGDAASDTATFEYTLLDPGARDADDRRRPGAHARRGRPPGRRQLRRRLGRPRRARGPGCRRDPHGHPACRGRDRLGLAERAARGRRRHASPGRRHHRSRCRCVRDPRLVIEGSITDTRITSYTLIGLPPGGEPVLLDERSESRSGELASLATLSEGPQTLSVAAEDAARNRTTLDRSFIIDSIAPVVRITTLGEGAVLAANAGTVSVTGRVDDANLVEAALSFGPGIDPPFFAEIARTTVAGDGVALGDWNVSSLSDGSYTLLVVATDCSGSTSEVRASVTIDATPPTATIGDPAAGDAINGTLPITGTAADENLTGWELAFAPGEAASAFQWTPIATAQTGVVDATLAESWPLPARRHAHAAPDGDGCRRTDGGRADDGDDRHGTSRGSDRSAGRGARRRRRPRHGRRVAHLGHAGRSRRRGLPRLARRRSPDGRERYPADRSWRPRRRAFVLDHRTRSCRQREPAGRVDGARRSHAAHRRPARPRRGRCRLGHGRGARHGLQPG